MFLGSDIVIELIRTYEHIITLSSPMWHTKPVMMQQLNELADHWVAPLKGQQRNTHQPYEA